MSFVGCPPPESWNKLNIFLVRHAESNNNVIYEQTRATYGQDCSEEILVSEYNRLHHHDPNISPRGNLQASKLCDFLQNDGIPMLNKLDNWKILSSPMTRCLQTAAEVSRGLNDKQFIVMPNFYESDGCYHADETGRTFGIPGMTKAETEAAFPNCVCAEGMENGWFLLPHKETCLHFRARTKGIVDFLWEYASGEEGGNGPEDGHHAHSEEQRGLVIVAHGNVLNALISQLTGGNGLVTHNNTGVSHLQLHTTKRGVPVHGTQCIKNIHTDSKTGQQQYRVAAVQYVNYITHLLDTPGLIVGNRPFKDSWIQEFINNDDLLHYDDDEKDDVLTSERDQAVVEVKTTVSSSSDSEPLSPLVAAVAIDSVKTVSNSPVDDDAETSPATIARKSVERTTQQQVSK